MAIRFRKSIKLAPGVRWNLSGGGSSWTFGPRGFSVGVGKRGSYLNTGIPGTGLYSRERIGGGARAGARASTAMGFGQSAAVQTPETKKVTCGVSDDGTLYFEDADGRPLSEHWVDIAKTQNRAAIQDLIARTCDNINDQVEALGRLHHDTPDPIQRPRFEPPRFEFDPPERPALQAPSMFDKAMNWLLSGVKKIEAANQARVEAFEAAQVEWQAKRRVYDEQLAARRRFIEESIYRDQAAMEEHLQASLQDIQWPRETDVNFEIDPQGRSVWLDVDLPEIEDMPKKLATVPARGLKLSVKELSAAKVQKLYAEHVHGILFRIIGETFAALPNVDEVTIAGYSQRPSKADGQVRDEYLLSVRVVRTDWMGLSFKNLAHIDPAEALARFDLRRDMLKSGILRAIEPHELFAKD